MKNQRKKWVALICATAVWFSFVVNHSIQGAQIETRIGSSTGSTSTVDGNFLDTNVVPVDTSTVRGMEWGSIIACAGALLIGYNLLTARKHGWGWFLLCAVGVVIVFIGKMGVSLFCEISSDATGVSDWDSD